MSYFARKLMKAKPMDVEVNDRLGVGKRNGMVVIETEDRVISIRLTALQARLVAKKLSDSADELERQP